MNAPIDPRFIITFAAPVSFNGVTFAAARVEITEQKPSEGLTPGTAGGYRFRPVRDTRAEDSEAPEPVWAEIGGEYFAPDDAPTEANALAVIIAAIETPPVVAVPASIGPAQLRIALRRLHPSVTPGAIYAVIAALPQSDQDDARDWYDYATQIERNHPVLFGFACAFELTPEDVDAIFRLAATL